MVKRSAPSASGPKKGEGVDESATADTTATSDAAADPGGRKKRKLIEGSQLVMSPPGEASTSTMAGNPSNAAAAAAGSGRSASRSRSVSPPPTSGNAATASAGNGSSSSSSAAAAVGNGVMDTSHLSNAPAGAAAAVQQQQSGSRPSSRPSSRLSTRSEANGPDAPPREKQIADLLAHRKLLLDRIRRCRDAAAQRLREPPRPIATSTSSTAASGEAAATAMGTNAPRGKDDAGDGPAKFSEQDEIEAFKLLSQRAIAATRRQSTSASAANAAAAALPASDRGLRRGGSVGRRMAAAVSTLQNAGSLGGWVSDGSSTNGGTSAVAGKKASAASAAAAKADSKASASAAGTAAIGKSAGKQLATPSLGPAAPTAAAAASTSGKSGKKKKSAAAASGTGSPTPSGGGGEKPPKKKKKKGSGEKSSSSSGGAPQQQQIKGGSSAPPGRSSSQSQSSFAAAFGGMDAKAIALLSRPKGQEAQILQQFVANPRVVCPRARALRTKRDAIRDKLEKLVKERNERETKVLRRGLVSLSNSNAASPPDNSGDSSAAATAASPADTDAGLGDTTTGATSTAKDNASPTSVALRGISKSTMAELVESKPAFLRYAVERKRSAQEAAAASSVRAGRRSPMPMPLPSQLLKQPFRPEPRNPSTASRPAPRRKTHWDYVLEEMRWAAADFEAERTWKGAAGRTLGSSVLAFHTAHGGGKGSPLKGSRVGGGRVGIATPGMSPRKKRRGEGGSTPTLKSTDDLEELVTDEDLEPTVVDLDRARTLSKGLSVLVMGHWDLVAKGNAKGVGAEGSGVASATFKAARHKILSDYSSGPDATNVKAVYKRYKDTVKALPGMAHAEVVDEAPENDSTKYNDGAAGSQAAEEPSYEAITERLDEALKRADLIGTQPSKKKRPVESADCTVELQPSQVDAIHFVEAAWEVGGSTDDTPTLGVTFSGKPASGKTVAMAAALWRHSDEGAQILLCHSARLIRWRHELRRFGGLNIMTFGDFGWQFDDRKRKSFASGDVILCEFTSLPLLVSSVGKNTMSGFVTMTIDSRCPQSDALSQNSRRDLPEQAPTAASAISPPEVASTEITSTKWWKHLLQTLLPSSFGAKRLLIEGAIPIEDTLPPTMEKSNEKKSVELLAMKVAFMHHPRTFCSNEGNVGRSIISWAKKRHRAIMKNPAARTDLVGIKEALRGTIVAMGHAQEMYEQPNTKREGPPSWEVRLCEFPPLQKEAYKECCAFVKGSLSLTSIRIMTSSNPDLPPRAQRNAQALWAQAILRLRRSCVHSDLTKASSQESPNPSTAQWEKAKGIMANSSKMKQLATILHNECGYRIVASAADEEIEQIVSKTKAPIPSTKKKVLLLASSPDAQVLVSSFLSSLGIAHGKLLLPSSPAPATSTESTATSLSQSITAKGVALVDSLAWVENQHTLSRFNASTQGIRNRGKDKSSKSSACDVLIASPYTIGSQYGGLSASAADVVVSIDEDWSGQSQELIESILTRNLMHHGLGEEPNSSKPRPKWIKLICDESCEKLFLFPDGLPPAKTIEDSAAEVDESPPKKRQKRGGGGRKGRKGKATPEKAEKKSTDKSSNSQHVLLATSITSANVLKFRNRALTSVLGEHFKALSETSSLLDNIFLPSLAGEDATATDLSAANNVQYTQALLEEESRALLGPKSVLQAHPTTLASAAISSLSISRRDINSASVRAYIDHLAQSFLLSSASGSNKQPSMLLSNAAAASGRLRVPGSDPDFADGGFGGDPVEMAASALYIGSDTMVQNADGETDFEFGAPTKPAAKDGSEGQDGAVYFPPAFPNMLIHEYKRIAHEEHRAAIERQQAVMAAAAAADAAKSSEKAGVKAIVSGKQAGGKRPRNSKGMSTPLPVASSTVAPAGTAGPPPAAASAPHPRPVGRDVASGPRSVQGYRRGGFNTLSSIGSVFGMSGLPDPRESAQAAAKTLTQCLSYTYLDEEDGVDGGNFQSESIILFTKKGTSMLRRATSFMPTFNAFGGQSVAVKPPSKKSKKGQQIIKMPSVAPWAQPNASTGNDLQALAQIWDSRALNLLAQRGINPQRALRHASVRMRHRLSDRVTQLFISRGTSLGAGHGVPQLYLAQEAAGGFVLPRSLSNSRNNPCRTDFGPFNVGYLASKDGMVLGNRSKRRKLGIRLPMGVRLPHIPSRYPFHGPRADMSAEQWSKEEDKKLTESALRWRNNWNLIASAVSHLADGVSIWEKGGRYRAFRSPRQCEERWKRLLKSSPILVRQWKAGEAKVKELETVSGATSAFRKALAENAERPPLVLTVDAASAKDRIWGHPPSLLLRRAVSEIETQAKLDQAKSQDNGNDNAKDAGATEPPPSDQDKPKSKVIGRFATIRQAMKKRQRPKLQIPGVTGPDVTSIPVVSSHPSHAQSVELAVSQATGASGLAPPRMEMWPLQILDYADKVRAAKAGKSIASSGQQQARSSSSTSNTASSARNHQSGSLNSAARAPQHPAGNGYRQHPGSRSGIPHQRPLGNRYSQSAPRPGSASTQGAPARSAPAPNQSPHRGGSQAAYAAPHSPKHAQPARSPMQPSRNLPPSAAIASESPQTEAPAVAAKKSPATSATAQKSPPASAAPVTSPPPPQKPQASPPKPSAAAPSAQSPAKASSTPEDKTATSAPASGTKPPAAAPPTAATPTTTQEAK